MTALRGISTPAACSRAIAAAIAWALEHMPQIRCVKYGGIPGIRSLKHKFVTSKEKAAALSTSDNPILYLNVARKNPFTLVTGLIVMCLLTCIRLFTCQPSCSLSIPNRCSGSGCFQGMEWVPDAP